MFKFNELRVLPENHLLIVDVEIKRLPYYKDVYLDKVIIDTQDTFSESGISNNPLYTFNVDENKKYVRLEIDLLRDIDFSDENCMFFVYVTAKGQPSEFTPHGLDVPIALEVTMDYKRIYSKGMQFIKELNRKEILPKGFIDFVMNYNALMCSIRSRHYKTAIEYWKKFVCLVERPIYNKLPTDYGRINV